MTRAVLGHTGRRLTASPQTVAMYALITLGAVLRVAAPFGIFDYGTGMLAAAVAWAGGFILFLAVYGPMLFRPRQAEE
jgi:uncharacterized protein involved in response to NO